MNIEENKNTANTKTIILHVGVTKTGSTSIQQTLFYEKNRQLLLKKGYLYSKNLFSNHSLQLVSAFCSNPYLFSANVVNGLSRKEIDQLNSKNITLLQKEIKHTKFNNLIISGEAISSLKKDELQAMKHFLTEQITKLKSNQMTPNFKVIMYIRNHCDHASSRIQNMIRWGICDFHTGLKLVIDNLDHYYSEKIKIFQQVFGIKKFYIYKFEDAIKNPNGVSGHFLSLLKLSEKDLSEFKFFREKKRISMKTAEILSFVNKQAPLINNQKLNEGRYMGDTQALFALTGRKFDLTNEQKMGLLSKARPDINWLKTYFGIDYTQFDTLDMGTNSTNPENSQILYTKEDCKFICKALKKIPPIVRSLILIFFEVHLASPRFTKIKQTTFTKNLKKYDKKIRNKENLFHNFQLKSVFYLIVNYLIILSSGLFDKTWYYHNYPDIKYPKNPIIHYILHGASEMRNPSENFNTNYYIKQNKDVCYSAMNPLVHYILFGKREGRKPKNFKM